LSAQEEVTENERIADYGPTGGRNEGYSREPVPLAGHAALAGVFLAFVASAAAAARHRGVRLPERLALADIALAGVATAKLARIVTKNRVADFARAPFTELQGGRGRGEVDETPRGSGLRRSVGELVVCPYCVGVWIAGGFAAGAIAAPRATRAVAGALSIVEVADIVQMAHTAVADVSAS
jgi:hypothetical protein